MEMTPELERRLQQAFKKFNKFMLLMWRLGLGKFINIYPPLFGRILVLTHTGRKTGKIRRTPVNYNIVDGELYCTAGFGSKSDWYRNMLAHPDIEIWLAEGRYTAVAEDVSDHPQRLKIMRAVLIGSGFVAPLMGIDPGKLSDADLDALTREYRLFHLRKVAERTGEGGPGDLNWVWMAATLILLPLALRRRK